MATTTHTPPARVTLRALVHKADELGPGYAIVQGSPQGGKNPRKYALVRMVGSGQAYVDSPVIEHTYQPARQLWYTIHEQGIYLDAQAECDRLNNSAIESPY